jgi:hypothetical protein
VGLGASIDARQDAFQRLKLSPLQYRVCLLN